MPGTSTLLLDRTTWDLVLDAQGNIAAAAEPYSLAQDAASAIRTFLGEVFWNTTTGVPYLTRILGKSPPLSLIKQLMVDAALTVPGVSAARCFVTSLGSRGVAGQVQVTSAATGKTSAASFTVVNPQTGGPAT